MSTSNYNIEKLDDANYEAWCIQMQSVLICQDLWEIVSGDYTKPEVTDDNQVQVNAWVKKDQKAKAIIILSIAPTQLLHIKNALSAKAAWEALKDIYKPKGPARKVTLFKSLLGMRMSDADNVQQYVCKFCTAANKLAEIGIEIQQEAIVIILLASLPRTYENLVVALESRDELPSLDAVKIKLIEEGDRRKEYNAESNGIENVTQAFMIRENEKKNFASNSKNDKKQNHVNKRQFKCYTCGRKGHFSAQCRDKNKGGGTNQFGNNNKHTMFAAVSNSAFIALNDILHENAWCVDSGATSHICGKRELFSQFEESKELIMLAGENTIEAKGRGDIQIRVGDVHVTLKDVLFVPSMKYNFISVAKAIKNGYTVVFNSQSAIFRSKHEEVVLCAEKKGDLYIMQTCSNGLFYAKGHSEESIKWHKRFGHLNFESMRQMTNKQLVRGMNVIIPADISCSVCMLGKCTQKSFQSSENRADEILKLVHTDLCGPINKASIGGSKYILTFIDDKSRFVFVYFLTRKDQVLEKFKEFKNMVELQTDKKIKILRSDNGTEFVNNQFNEFLKNCGIVRQLTVPYTPQQNGIAERFNRTLVDMARCMLIESNVDESLWAEAVNTAAYLRNRAPSRALGNTTPFEVWYGYKPTVTHLKVFGSKVIALNKKHKSKFEPRGKEYLLVGYSEVSKAYRLYNAVNNKLIVSRDVYVVESIDVKQSDDFKRVTSNDNNFVHVETMDDSKENSSDIMNVEPEFVNEEETIAESPENSGVELNVEPEMIVEPQYECNISDDDEYVSADEDNVIEESTIRSPENIIVESARRGPGRPKIIRTGARGRPRKQYNMLNIAVDEVPTTVAEALSGKYANEWRAAMETEYKALINNHTWQLTELPNDQKAVGNKWVFALKRNKDGNIERFKARLVAKGCSQKYGVNYTDTYSPVARYETVRLIFAIAAEYELYMDQMDVTTAYLNSELDEEVYLKQPDEFIDQEHPDRVLRLNKALYGLKQSGRQWNKKLDNILRDIGFVPCKSEPCVYTKHHDDRLNIIVVYVDDLLLACTNKNEMLEFKRLIGNQVKVVDKGPVQVFISIEVNRESETGAIAINQKSQIRKLLNKYNMECCRPISVPLDPGHQVKCENDGCKKVDQTEYQSLIGSLMYIAICTRPDILHSVCKLSQRNSDPHHEHLAAAKRVLKYLSSTIEKQLQYRKSGKEIECFADADWGSDTSDRKSYTGYVFVLAGAVVSYESKKQSAVALSSTEAEYMAMSLAVKEATYLKKLMEEMKLVYPTALIVNGDNLSAQNLVKNPVYHSRSKHIGIRYHYIRDAYKSGEIKLKYCSTNEMVADVLTKNLPKASHEKFTTMMGVY